MKIGPEPSSQPQSDQRKTYIDVLKSPDDKSTVWYYFLKSEDGKTAKCKNESCKKVLKTKLSNTTGLRVHLKSCHKIDLTENKRTSTTVSAEETGPKKKPRSIADHFRRDNKFLDKTLARMSSKDGMPFKLFCTSEDLRSALVADGFLEIPKSPNTINTRVMGFANLIRRDQKDLIKRYKTEDKKFSVSFDEWTSKRNRRYLNLILHAGTSEIWNLGLVRIHGSMNAESCLAPVSKKLLTYGLNMENDIVSIATEGTSMMTQIGKLSPTHQQLCFAHGIQLAVIDVLHAKAKTTSQDAVVGADCDDVGANSGISMDVEGDGSENSDDDNEDEMFILDNNSSEISDALVKPVISKVRSIVKMFRKLPLKNYALQKYAIEDKLKEQNFILDSKTRWTSLLSMLERFQILKNLATKSLNDFDSENGLKEQEWKCVSDLIDALQPVKATVEVLCRRDADLFTADVALKYAVDKLEEQNIELSMNLSEALVKRIAQRRTEYSGLIKYLRKREIDKDKRFGSPTSAQNM